MKAEKQTIIDKIQKLIRLGNDQAETPEGKSAMRMAGLMMAKHRITEMELDLETDAFNLDQFEVPFDGTDVPQWVPTLCGCFADTFDCKIIMRRREAHQDRQFDVIGTMSDVETAMYFIEVVLHHIMAECWKTWPQPSYRGKREQVGNVAVNVIWQRASELKAEMVREFEEEDSSMALVVKRDDELQEAVAEMFPHLKKASQKKQNLPSDAKSLIAGSRAGETAPMNFAVED